MHTTEQIIAALRAELKASEEKRLQAEANAKNLKRQTEKLQKQAEKLEERAEKLEKERDDYRDQLELHDRMAKSLALLCATAIKDGSPLGDDITQAELDRLDEIVRQAAMNIELAKRCSGIVKYFWRKASEKTSKNLGKEHPIEMPAEEDEPGEVTLRETVLERKRGIHELEKKNVSVLGVVNDAIRQIAKDPATENDSVLKACSGISETAQPTAPEPKSLPKNGKKTVGRKVPKEKANDNTINQPQEEPFTCPRCGRTEFVQIGQYEECLRYLSKCIGELLQSGKFARPVMECTSCGFKHVVIPDDFPTPATPNQGTVSNDLVCQLGVMQGAGLTELKSETLLCTDRFDLGSDTLLRNTHRWTESGPGHYLIEAIKDAVRNRAVVQFDETPIDIQQCNGESVKKVECNSKQGYLLAATSVPDDDKPFAIFTRLDSRSGESIAKQLGAWTPEVIVTDGWQAYDTALSRLGIGKTVGRQICNVHLRRLILRSLDIESLEEVTLRPDGAMAAQKKIQEKDPQYLMCVIVDGYRKLYGIEATLRRRPNETREQQLERIAAVRKRKCVKLMDNIDVLMKSLAERYAVREKDKYCRAVDSDLAEAVVHYMNNRDGLRLFLHDPRVSPDSNAVEGAIRRPVLYKQAAHFKQSPDFVESLCGWFSLVETARLNGVRDPVKWLTSFAEKFYRVCLDWSLTKEYEDPERKTKKRTLRLSGGFHEDAVGHFNFYEWLPWEYSKREPKAD